MVAGVSGCGPQGWSQGGGTAKHSDNLTFSYTQPGDLPVIYTNPFANAPTAPKAGTGYEDYAGYGDNDPYACRDCSYTNDIDLGASLRGQEQFRAIGGTTSLSGALSTYAGTLWSYGTNSGLNGRMQAASTAANNALSGSYASGLFKTIDDIKSLVELYPGALGHVTVQKPAPQTWAVAFQPVNARAKTSDLGHTYNWQPDLFRDLRFRGAKSYCALRQAAREQRSTGDNLDSLGARSVGSWWLWDYGNGETTVKIGGPTRDTTSTGANVFVIPIAIGARVSPLHGPLFPDFPEIVHPLVWVTGDAEVESWCSQNCVTSHVNAQHADFWAGQYVEDASLTISQLPLFSWGLVTVKASGDMHMTMGKPESGMCSGGTYDSALADGRVWYQYPEQFNCNTNQGYAARTSAWDFPDAFGRTLPSAYASDAPLFYDGNATWPYNLMPVENNGLYDEYTPWAAVLPLGWAMAERWVTNDDRSVVIRDSAKEELALSVDFGIAFGPVQVGIDASSSVSDEAIQLTTVRDHMSLAAGEHTDPIHYVWQQNADGKNPLPQTNFVVTSETKNVSTFDPLTLTAKFDLDLDFWVGHVHVHWEQPFFSLDAGPTEGAADQIPEAARLRVGEDSDVSNDFTEEGTTGHVVMSHLPTPPPADPVDTHFFASWPCANWPYCDSPGDQRDVPSCLADPSTPADPPPPGDGTPGQKANGAQCWYGPSSMCSNNDVGDSCNDNRDACNIWPGWNLPNNACDPTVQAQFLAQFGGLDYTCMHDMLAYLCTGTHLEQSWGAEGNVVSRVYNPYENPATVNNIFDECVIQEIEAHAGTPEQAQCLAHLYGGLFKMHACKPDGTLDGNP